MKNVIAVMGGAGNIGSAVITLLLRNPPGDVTIKTGGLENSTILSIDVRENDFAGSVVLNVQDCDVEQLTDVFKEHTITHVINAMPFFLNSKIAQAAVNAGCNYLDFTEDDAQAAAVYDIYANSPELACAPKCGLAPGFINYLGHSLVKDFDSVDTLNIRVGALPKNIRYETQMYQDGTYALSWSVDGLVNEYIRSCQVKVNGEVKTVDPLIWPEELILDGVKYEAATTSGGVGSLIHDLPDVKNINYKTIRYPGHYGFIKATIKRVGPDFDALKKRFLELYPYTRDDVIVVYGEALGMRNGRKEIESFSARYQPGFLDLTGIQLTTAGGALATLELIVNHGLKGAIRHNSIDFNQFKNTHYFKTTYRIV
jgi:saccharopine dehydrogenase-like NADP-dependent oxidoreductase